MEPDIIPGHPIKYRFYLKKQIQKQKINEFIYDNGFVKNEIIYLGDQLVTDIAGANNASLDSVLVSTIDVSSQKWYTKINRLREKKIIKEIYKIDSLLAKKIEETVNRGKKNG